MAMTNEEIDAEIARLQSLKEQNNKAQAAESNKPATGIYNPADYVSQITNSMNKSQSGSGNKFSNNLNLAKNAGKRSSKTEDMFGNPLPDTAYEYITQMLNTERAKGPVNKHTLRMIENSAKLYYNVPSKFDISGKGWFSNTDSKMAKAMNSMSYNGKSQTPVQTPAQKSQAPVQKSQAPAQKPQTPVQQVTKAETRPQGKPVSNTNKGVASANVGDHIIRSDGSMYVLTKGDIDWAKKKIARQTQQVNESTVRGTAEQMKADIKNGDVKPTYNDDSIAGATQEELDIMKSKGLSDDLYNKGMQAIKNGNGLTDDDIAFMKQFDQYRQQVSSRQAYSPEAKKFITDQANVARYRKLYQRKKDTKQ